MKSRLFPLLAAAMASLAAATAHADTVTYSGSFNGLTDVTNQAIAVSQFNPNLGTLQSASFQLSATMTTDAFANNDGNFYAGWDKLVYSLSLVGDAPYSGLAVAASNAPARLVGTGTPDGSFTLAEMLHLTSSPNLWTFTGPTLAVAQTFAQGALGAFSGNGNLSFFLTTVNSDALAVAGAQTGGLPASYQGLHTNVASQVLVTYTYAVPEPSTYALFGVGVLFLGFVARKRGAHVA
ncbi:MAG: choice-of-anchor E domain-containing protein [Betaproteobacteria bacterium]